ncbi:MAG: 30S ribosomal protein S21 A [Verrucomicrobia bacterium ADurb.Bin118]|nr:MAG: 30S ribosomal protein S21 A [Verrucomicrobia bacterium ADurb.Bin118]
MFCRLTRCGGKIHFPPDRRELAFHQPAIRGRWRGSEFGLTEIKLKKGEPIERALRRLKKKMDREGTLRTVRSHRHYEKPSEKRRRKEKAAAFSAMLKARYADL